MSDIIPLETITQDRMGELWNGTSVTLRDILKSSKLFPIRVSLNKQYGLNLWGVNEVGQYLLNSRANRGDKKGKQRIKVEAKKVYKDTERSVVQRVDAYISNFEGVTPNDIQTFRQMAVLEQQMVEIEARLQLKEQLDPKDLKTLGELYTKLSGEFRQLQSVLGIDRSSRETQVDTAAELKKMIGAAKELLKKNSIPITCKSCAEKGVVIAEGYVLFHFRNDVKWSWDSVCPQCGNNIHLEGKGKNNDEPSVAAKATGAGIAGDVQPSGIHEPA